MLVDTSVWIDHLRRGNARLVSCLEAGEVEVHPFVIGELACVDLGKRSEILSLMAALPVIPEADHEEVLAFVDSNRLMEAGLGWVDMHLLASTRLGDTTVWTLHKGMASAAAELGIAFRSPR